MEPIISGVQVAALFHIGTTKAHPPIPDHLSTEAKDFLLKCLEGEPNLRPDALELLQILSFRDNRGKVHRDAIEFCQNVLRRKPVDWIASVRSNLLQPNHDVDLVVTVGGDSTLLQARHLLNDSIPLLGDSDPTQPHEARLLHILPVQKDMLQTELEGCQQQLRPQLMLPHTELRLHAQVCHIHLDEGFPAVTFYFENSLTLTVYPHDYLFHLKGSVCFGWQNFGTDSLSRKDTMLLGDLVLSNKLVLYDLENQTIGWTEYNCSSSIKLRDDITRAAK